MKITPSNSFPSTCSKWEQLLPLVPKEGNTLTKDNSVVLESCTILADATSAKIKASVCILRGDEELWDMIKWCDDILNKVFVGLNLTTGVNQKTMALNLMEGNPKSLFTDAIVGLASDDHFTMVAILLTLPIVPHSMSPWMTTALFLLVGWLMSSSAMSLGCKCWMPSL